MVWGAASTSCRSLPSTSATTKVMSSPLAGPLVPGIGRGTVSAKGPRVSGAGMASVSMGRGFLLSPSRDYARAALQCPSSSSSLLATSKPWFSGGPAHCAHDPSPPPSPQGPLFSSCRAQRLQPLLPAFLRALLAALLAISCQSCSRGSAKHHHQGIRCDYVFPPFFPSSHRCLANTSSLWRGQTSSSRPSRP